MSHRYLLSIFIIIFVSCMGEQPEGKKQYYSVYVHNNSDEKITNMKVYRQDSSIIEFSFGILPAKISKSESFLHIPPKNKLVVKWNNSRGDEYERVIDLNGIFPTKFNGGDLHIVIDKGYDVNYTFVKNRTVYSPANRTAQ